jgi:cytochrome c-type biogenesis protein CcmH/NrfG
VAGHIRSEPDDECHWAVLEGIYLMGGPYTDARRSLRQATSGVRRGGKPLAAPLRAAADRRI